MIDGLISGAGSLTDGADWSVRALSGGSRRGFASTRPGSLMTLSAPRPPLRVVAATGPIFLSFATEAERDRAAAAELLVESGLGQEGASQQTA